MIYYEKGKSIADYNFIYKIDACLRHLLDLNKPGCMEYIEESDFCNIDLYSLFDKGKFLEMFDTDIYNCFCAIVDGNLLMVEITKNQDKKQKICKIYLFPNANNKFVEKQDEKGYTMRIIDGLGNIYNNWYNWLCCADIQEIEKQRIHLTDVIQPISYGEIAEKIGTVRNREQLINKVVSLDDEDVMKVLRYINENLENENEHSKKLLLSNNK